MCYDYLASLIDDSEECLTTSSIKTIETTFALPDDNTMQSKKKLYKRNKTINSSLKHKKIKNTFNKKFYLSNDIAILILTKSSSDYTENEQQ